MIGEIGGSAEEEAAAWIKAALSRSRSSRSSRADGAAGTPHGPRGAIIAGWQGLLRREDGRVDGAGVRRG
jgi:succinyl-CoA synthetase alpha subunit